MHAAAHVSSRLVPLLSVVLVLGAVPLVTRSHPLQAQSPGAPDVTTLGPQAGDPVPDFRLPDQHGQTRTLSSLMGPRGLMLVFIRSADW